MRAIGVGSVLCTASRATSARPPTNRMLGGGGGSGTRRLLLLLLLLLPLLLLRLYLLLLLLCLLLGQSRTTRERTAETHWRRSQSAGWRAARPCREG